VGVSFEDIIELESRYIFDLHNNAMVRSDWFEQGYLMFTKDRDVSNFWRNLRNALIDSSYGFGSVFLGVPHIETIKWQISRRRASFDITDLRGAVFSVTQHSRSGEPVYVESPVATDVCLAIVDVLMRDGGVDINEPNPGVYSSETPREKMTSTILDEICGDELSNYSGKRTVDPYRKARFLDLVKELKARGARSGMGKEWNSEDIYPPL
jgi:hypothetical protein